MCEVYINNFSWSKIIVAYCQYALRSIMNPNSRISCSYFDVIVSSIGKFVAECRFIFWAVFIDVVMNDL